MPSFTLYDLDPEWWSRVQIKAKAEGTTLKALILKLLTQWLGVLVVAMLASACGQSPFTPSGVEPGAAFVVPAVLQPVMEALDAETWIHPLIGEPMGQWVRRNLAGIVMDDTLPATVGARFDRTTHLLHWQPRDTPATLTVPSLVGVLLHEARHGQGYLHSCGSAALSHDRTMEEGGAFAVQILYLEHETLLHEAAFLRRDYIGC